MASKARRLATISTASIAVAGMLGPGFAHATSDPTPMPWVWPRGVTESVGCGFAGVASSICTNWRRLFQMKNLSRPSPSDSRTPSPSLPVRASLPDR